MKYLLLIIVVIAAGCGYYFFSPSIVLQRKTEAALKEFSSAVASNDRGKVSATLQKIMSETAQFHLEVNALSIANPEGTKLAVQDFDRASLISFIDNILYTLHDYSYEPELKSFALSADKKSAKITFSSKEYADGASYYSGTPIEMRYIADSNCEGQVVFVEKNPLLDKASCIMNLQAVPKPEEAYKLRDPEVMRQYLR